MYIADLHIHSKYSRATSKQCVPEYLDLWSRRKGIDLLGTGDFTHPAWRDELKEKLVPAEDGLYLLRDEFRQEDHAVSSGRQPRFVITGEISSIYKKDGKVRKVHNLILLPGLDEAEALSRKLEAIGNIHSDGRPILGLDSRDLLEITLETCPDAVFIPAHIWTPHFSMFGAFSGFDTIEECFDDLTPYIHALETGLSSDPDMNRRLSALDTYTLVSNSDAHSPSKLGREANLIEGGFSYRALKKALSEGESGGFRGTIEFFPEEGKYHLDGHRNCHLCLKPAETIQFGGRCPVCGKKITIGVQHRVEELADRDEGVCIPGALPFESLAPLPEVIAASTGQSAAGKKVNAQYEELLAKLGPEFEILRQTPIEDIQRVGGACVAEGIRRLRAGQVERIPGYDGEYGVIRLLSEAEIKNLSGQMTFLSLADLSGPEEKGEQLSFSVPAHEELSEEMKEHTSAPADLLDGLNARQMEAVTAPDGVVTVVAGPGTGKTKTLVSRIAYLAERRGVKPGEVTAVTFTNKAAGEMRDRLEKQLGGKRAVRNMTIGTFHSICIKLLEETGCTQTLVGENEALELAEEIAGQYGVQLPPLRFLREVSKMKNGMTADEAVTEEIVRAYQKKLEDAGVMDLDDLLLKTLDVWENEKKVSKQSKRFSYLLVDEFQDINEVQYRLIRAWSRKSKGLFVIGDPDQSIYGFRGSVPACFSYLDRDFPELRKIRLEENYRSTPEILESALRVISANRGEERILKAHLASGEPVRLLTAQSDMSEAIYIAKQINQLVGGIDMLDAYGFARPKEECRPRSFSEIAVLYRTHRQGRLIEKCLRQEGIPYSVVGRDDLLADRTVRGAVALFRFLLDPQDVFSMRACLRYLCGATDELCDRMEAAIAGTPVEEVIPCIEAFRDEPLANAFIRWGKDFSPQVKKVKPAKLIEAWADTCGLAESEVIQKMLNMAVFHADMDSFLKAMVLGQEGDVRRSSGKAYTSDAVTLMTLHGCKGLEFPVVFLCGVKEGSIPLEAKSYPTDIEEERRLFFVGMTRAREELYLMTSSQPSSFLADLPAELIVKSDAASPKKQSVQQLSMFDL